MKFNRNANTTMPVNICRKRTANEHPPSSNPLQLHILFLLLIANIIIMNTLASPYPNQVFGRSHLSLQSIQIEKLYENWWKLFGIKIDDALAILLLVC